MKNILKYLLLGLLIPMAAFPLNRQLNCANEHFRSENYEKAYKEFAWFLFQHGNGGSKEDYFVAMIGKNSCMKFLDASKMFAIERQFFAELLEASLNSNLTFEQDELLSSVMHQSVYWDFISE